MKKTAVLIASVILSIFCSLPVFATGNNLPEEKTIGVFAKAVYTLPDGCYGAKKDNDGHYVVELPDGIKITLTSKSDVTSLRMVIFPITKQDKRAYQWISDCTTNCGTNILFYEIYFIDEYGTRVNVKKTLQVNITLPKGYGVPKVAKISKDEVMKIAEMKMPDLNAANLDSAYSMICGTARSMGIVVEE